MRVFRVRGSILCMAAAAAFAVLASGQVMPGASAPGGGMELTPPTPHELHVIVDSDGAVGVTATWTDGQTLKSVFQDGAYVVQGAPGLVKLVLTHPLYGESVVQAMVPVDRAVGQITISYVDGRAVVSGTSAVTLAASIAGGVAGEGDCCIANGTPGCDDPACEALICGIDPFCCDVAWDGICADEALAMCAICQPEPCQSDDDCPPGQVCLDGLCVTPGCPLDCPPGASDEGEPCGDDTNGGCNSTPPVFTPAACGDTFCGTAWADGGTRDTDWYLVDHPGGNISATAVSQLPVTVFIVDGIAACAPVVVGNIGCADGCANIAVASADLPAGQYVVFVATGDCGGGGIFDGFPCGLNNNYYVTIECAGPCMSDDDCPPGLICVDGVCIIPPPTNDLCEDATPLDVPPGGSVDIIGSTTQATGPDALDGCGTSVTAPGVWYSVVGNGNTMTASTCNQANYDTKISVYCQGCGAGGPTSDCCIANGTPGCDDPACEAAVCAIDPFCCDVTWDGICAGEAIDLCEVCQAGDGLLCVVGLDDTPGCGGFTTEVSWCAQAGSEYLILVHGFGSAVGDFTLTVSDNDSPCIPSVECIPPVPEGACCQCDGSISFCTIETEEDCLALGGFYLGDDSSCEAGGEQVTVTSSPGLAIPDDTGDPGATDTIMMGMDFTIADLEVALDISHTWIGDLCVKLSKDGGPPVELIRRMNFDGGCAGADCCGCSSNDMDVVLDDEAAESIEDQCGAGGGLLTGTYRPDPGMLSMYYGGSSAGMWTLSVSDNAGGDLGTLNSWSLIFTQPAGGPSPCEDAFPCAIPLTLIIKQGACPAPVNPGSNGVTLMVVAGEMGVDMSMIDPDSVKLSRCDGIGGFVMPNDGPPGPPGIQIADLNHPNPDPATCETGGCTCNEDQYSDGIDDLKLKFNTDEMAEVLELYGEMPGAIITLEVEGSLMDGTAFTAADCIRIVGPNAPPGALNVVSDIPGIWVEATPLDDLLDGGGYAEFYRTYPAGSVVTLTAPAMVNGHPFTGWVSNIDGVDHSFPTGKLTVSVVVGGEGTMRATYSPLAIFGAPTPSGPGSISNPGQ